MIGTETWWSALAEAVEPATVLRRDEPLAPKTTMRVGGPARFYAEPASVADLVLIRAAAREAEVECFFLGRGSNLIVMDAGFDGLVIRLHGKPWRDVRREGDALVAMAGARLKRICAVATAEGFDGFAFLEGIPGTLGGSLRMNAGAMGGWIFDLVESVRCLEEDGSVTEHPRSFFAAGYRSCPQLCTRVALSARLQSGGVGEPLSIRAQVDNYATKRRASQPREPSAGCIFKNPPGDYAGKLVDELGFKGTGEGGAMVSPVHGNFIVNTGGTRAEDILALVRRIRARARTERGVELEPEALLLGAKWEDVL
ncbi:MAG: UDP-N-acetylmuramate dehydrogenase [Verrucomicrobiota bacterium]